MVRLDPEDTAFVNEVLTIREDGIPTFQWNIQYPESLHQELLAQGMTEAEWDEMQQNANRILNAPRAVGLFGGLMSTSDEQMIPTQFALMEDEEEEDEEESEEDEDEFFSLSPCTDATDTLQEEAFTRSQSSENSSISRSSSIDISGPSSASQELEGDAHVDTLINGIAVTRGVLRGMKQATLDEARWSSFMEDCDAVNNQVIACLTKDLAFRRLPTRTALLIWIVSLTSASLQFTAVEQCSPEAPDIAAIHHNVGNGYYRRSHTTGGDDIERAIKHFDLAIAIGTDMKHPMILRTCNLPLPRTKRALALVSSDEPALDHTRAICLINGGNLLIHQYDRSLERNIACLEKAISYLQTALQLREREEDPDTSRPLQALGHAKLRYFFRTLSPPSLAGAVDCFEKATFVGEGHVSFPLIAHNLALGHAISHFFSQKPDSNQGSADLVKAIMWIERALKYRPSPHAHRPSSLLIYSWCLLEVLQTPSMFQESYLQKLESSLQELEKGDAAAVAIALKHRAYLATWRYNETQDPERLVDALQYSESAMKTLQDLHNGQYSFSPLDICEVTRMRLEVLKLNDNDHEDAAVKEQINQAFGSLEQASSMSASTCDIMDQLSIASIWVSQALEMKHHFVVVAYPILLRILRDCMNLNPAIEIRYAIAGILRPISPADVAAAIMGSSDPNLAQAVELLEYGRDIVLSHIRAMRQDDEHVRNLGSMDSDAVARFESVCKQLDRNVHGLFLSSSWKWSSVSVPGEAVDVKTPLTWEDFLQNHGNVLQERDKISVELLSKEFPETRINPSPSYAELKKAANGGTIVLFNFSKYGCDALIIVEGNESPVRVPLGGEREYQYFASLASALDSSLKLDDTVESDGKLQKVLKALWRKAVEPVTKELKVLSVEVGSRLWLLPTGLARRFPLHAAGPYKSKGFEPSDLSSLYAISYISTLGMLLSAKMSSTLVRRDEPPLVLFIGDDGEGNPAVEALPHVKIERDIIAKEFGDRGTCLFGEQATVDAVLVNLPSHPWVHFGCHGSFDPERPFQSCFTLNGQSLTLPTIMRSRSLKGEFAFYSACDTASSPDQTSGEVVNLASAMEICGFRSVIGTLYPIYDDFAVDVCREFYRSARSRGWIDVAYSLKDSILELRRRMWAERKELDIRKWIAYIHIGV
ncbi:CHAT domain-containing protein [Desarmillaria tabescens]|uniref:CHAT domain-containing protein n=1 Tax=Armillaria tabescens TaxID=1929756 RepID=A0AA39NCB7_ARMTA|nr:CHAT domain-containing protein [Desarmillaria tabescens]KAK0462984.1 CHAT domain-containing protein [Desarmillaria tabescens]